MSLDLKNNKLHRIIYSFRGLWWTILSLILAATIVGFSFVKLFNIKVDENYAPAIVICILLVWGGLAQLPERILWFIDDRVNKERDFDEGDFNKNDFK